MAGLAATLGSGATTNSLGEIFSSDVALVIGSNTTWNHPVFASMIKGAVAEKGMKLIVCDPRRIELAASAEIFLQQQNGSDVALLSGLQHIILREGWEDAGYIAGRCEGFDAYRRSMEFFTPERVEKLTGVPRAELFAAAKLFATGGRGALYFCMGITQHTHGVENVKACVNLQLICGNVGFEGGGVNPLRGQNNVQGACDMGALPGVFTGYRSVTDEGVRREFARLWGVDEAALCPRPGLTETEMIPACGGSVRALFVLGENPLLSDANANHVERCFEKLDFLAVQDIFLTETAQVADVVLPGVSFAEKLGTFTNTERRVQLSRRALDPLGGAKQDYEIIADLAARFGHDFPRTPEELFEEIRAVTPQYAGMSYERIARVGLQWPCPDESHPGTPILHRGRMARGRGVLTPLRYRPPAEVPGGDWPMRLSTGRILEHFHTGSMTRRAAVLDGIEPRGIVEVNPDDAEDLGIRTGDRVRVATRRGAIETEARVVARVARGSLFVPFHFAEAAANRLTNDALDPESKIPEFKACAARLETLPRRRRKKAGGLVRREKRFPGKPGAGLEPALRERIEANARRYPRRESALMPALHVAQEAYGGTLPENAIEGVADLLRVPLSRAFGVATYFTLYNKKPLGRYHLQVDTGVPAMLAGADRILACLQEELGVSAGGTTEDRLFSLSEVEDLASSGAWPVIRVNDRYCENMTVARTARLIRKLRDKDVASPLDEDVASRLDEDVASPRDDLTGFATERHFSSACDILLKRRGRKDPTSIGGYIADGGYRALKKARAMKPEEVVAEVKRSSLRGRGGAGFPAGDKWASIPADCDRPVYLICNADEGEPGTFKDRQILEYDPHLVIEGMAIAAHAIGARLGFIYIRGEFGWIARILERAIDEARGADVLGGSRERGCARKHGADFDIVVHVGAGAYVCGEETALIESLEGKRGEPRLRPPFPTTAGLYGCPTLVNNVETLSCVPFIISEGTEAFRRIGVPGSRGPKIFSLSGHVRRPGAYEFPMGTALHDLLDAAGGVKGKLKAVVVGGLSTPLLTAAEAEGMTLDFGSCRDRGTGLGSGGIIVMNRSTSIPQVALRTIRFYAHESCGQCTPCREGTRYCALLLGRICAGEGSTADIDRLLSLCATVKGATLCPMGEAFAAPIAAMVSRFRGEFERLVRPS